MTSDKEKINGWIKELLLCLEEEDIGVSLFTNHYQEQGELEFFSGEDRPLVVKQLKKLTRDSKRHKKFLRALIQILEKEMK